MRYPLRTHVMIALAVLGLTYALAQLWHFVVVLPAGPIGGGAVVTGIVALAVGTPSALVLGRVFIVAASVAKGRDRP